MTTTVNSISDALSEVLAAACGKAESDIVAPPRTA
jgi:hypothetical protein